MAAAAEEARRASIARETVDAAVRAAGAQVEAARLAARDAANAASAAQAAAEAGRRAARPPAAFISAFDENEPAHNLGPQDVVCPDCGALHFEAEKPAKGELKFEKCCKKGWVHSDTPRPLPPLLLSLLTGNHVDSEHFLNNIRKYNAALSLTSCSVGGETEVDLNDGINVVRLHGELYHWHGPLIPLDGKIPAFAQLLFYSTEEATVHRLAQECHEGLKPELLEALHDELLQYNPYVPLYKTAKERLDEQRQQPGDRDYQLLLKPDMELVMQQGADRRRENLPVVDEVAGVIPDELDAPGKRDVVVASRRAGSNQTLFKVPVDNGLYMGLHYLLLKPLGEAGWDPDMFLSDPAKRRSEDPAVRLRATEDKKPLPQQAFYRYQLFPRRDQVSPTISRGVFFSSM